MIKKLILGLALLIVTSSGWAQLAVKGKVTDTNQEPLPGVTVINKVTKTGVITDIDGNYSIELADPNATLIFSFIGFETQEVKVGNRSTIDVQLFDMVTQLGDVVVVGYGVQKKESIVGAISQAKGEELMKSGGVSNLGQAMTGKVVGVTTIATSGRPGDEQPKIYIRGQSTWNDNADGTPGGQPLILVDGIERPMNDINPADVESISVLKDASATAVFGVKGANGVILITTKRGIEGKATLSVSANSTFKFLGKLPKKLDAYDGIKVMNESIERTMPYESEGWAGWTSDYIPMDIANKFRNPANEWESYTYPNVDWRDWVMKKYAMDHKVNLSVRGGTAKAKYFGSLSFTHTDDIFKGPDYNSGRSYKPSYAYNKFNYRTNIDFDITSTTKLSVNLAGYYGIQNDNKDAKFAYGALYRLSPTLIYPLYPDGLYGKHPEETFDTRNPIAVLTTSGNYENHRVGVNSDFVLEQNLGFITDGLSFKGTFALDNQFLGERGIADPKFAGNNPNAVWRIINRKDGTEMISDPGGVNQFDFVIQPWTLKPLEIKNDKIYRKLFYQAAINYAKKFGGVHSMTALALFSREQHIKGDGFPEYREDWVGRLTYDYDSRYFMDVNGAYNGSEKFGPGYRFDFFPSFAAGWVISNESFMYSFSTWLDQLKFRGSYGLVGDDQPPSKWAYADQWSSGDYAWMDSNRPFDGFSPYLMYRESLIGNPSIKWETATKMNVGADLGVFNNLITFTVDYFEEDRFDIYIKGRDRTIPAFFGAVPPDANVGKTKVSGVELSASVNYRVNQDLTLKLNGFYTVAKDEVLFMEEPIMQDRHEREAGGAIGQPKIQLPNEIMTSWDDVYMSPRQESNQAASRPGSYSVIDFNGDGIIDGKDRVPYGFPERPTNSWNTTLGVDYKNWSFMVQVYGAYNALKEYNNQVWIGNEPQYFEHLMGYWSVDNPSSTKTLTSWRGGGGSDPLRNWYDASYVKLQNVELAYLWNLSNGSSYRFYVNGNDLYSWSHLPDQRQEKEKKDDAWGNYPMFRRVNIGLNINF
jgi:TonB-linked SusC/RagA family outer membrane protein